MRTGISITITRSVRGRREAITRDRNASQKHAWRAAVPAGKMVHVILDNYAAHSIPRSAPGSTGTSASSSTSRQRPKHLWRIEPDRPCAPPYFGAGARIAASAFSRASIFACMAVSCARSAPTLKNTSFSTGASSLAA